ncbi:bifunctional pantoate--beta-alanine ligase/(d)CMP kinase [Neosynechococcus sphagnicola]|uniref:bifunctional pantoate--beta-alanine ligase/(d)CMP kinase n=1 Tax=Neosynechococcus sphagnicola TaxID=1501145 RepID=UPI0006902F99|nr:bifunctional pantoate--beta-alanine ligase/(d)CMP kinase [Neosynechococcus sphagnicola]
MRSFSTVAGLRCYLDQILNGSKWLHPALACAAKPSVGFVPTMGALHEGHTSLIQQARRDNDLVVVSIFVNPLQFAPTEDWQQYPRSLAQDRQLCEQASIDVLFTPTSTALQLQGAELEKPWQLTQVLPPPSLTAGLCGRSRPGHFQGVATIVSMLFHLVQPDRAYFGQKDAQQLAIIRQLVLDLHFPVEIIACPTVRESSGLAVSSRNQYLSAPQRQEAAVIFAGLQRAEQLFRSGERSPPVLIAAVNQTLATAPTVQLDYIELVDPESLKPLTTLDDQGLLAIAAYLGSTRLIDNLLLRNRRPIVAIDGPAGAGKSTVARRVAQVLGLLYLDTGAMYRAITWFVLQNQIEITDQPAIAELVSQCQIEIGTENDTLRVWVQGEDVTEEIRSLAVTAKVSAIAAQPAVRRALVNQQRRFGRQGGIVMEGRDIGTHVFPDAEVKIFLTASIQERARRRQLELQQQGKEEISLAQLEQAILSRDQQDSERNLSPLRQAGDAIAIPTDGLTIDQVVDQIVQLYQGARMGQTSEKLSSREPT